MTKAPQHDGLADEETTLDVFLAAYSHHPDGDVIASVIDPTDDLLTLGALRRILTALRRPPAITEEKVRHVAAILEEWDMKDPPDAFTGHAYEDIARDILARASPPPGADRNAVLAASKNWWLEEAARAAEQKYGNDTGWHSFYRQAGSSIAAAIRSLKSDPVAGDGGEE
jgi:hypothetical protein